MIRVYRLNCGSSGAADAALAEALRLSRRLCWAEVPEQADVFALTGPITVGVKPAVLRVWRDHVAGRAPLVVLGRDAVEGLPTGPGGISDVPELVVAAQVAGVAPAPAEIREVLEQVARTWRPEEPAS
jgi:Ni,Fe-hydrogenase III small subunit